MIKKIVYTLLITLAVLFTVGYFRYNSTVNIANKIPVNADAVIRLNLREIEYNMLKDVVKHPFLYFKSTDTSINKVDESKVSLFDGVEIPKNLFFYTNNSSLKNTWVSNAVKITDKKRLQSFFKQKKFVKSNSKLNVKYYTFKNFVCVINGTELVVFFAFNRIKNVEGKLNAVLKNKTYLLSNNAIFDKIKTSTQLVSIATNKDVFFELGVRSETLFLKGELTKNSNLFLQHNTQNNKESLVSISGKIDKNLLLGFVNNKQKKKFKKLTNLSLDSICNYWNGEINTQLISFISKKDTILTYEYDDDFNRITKKKVQETIIPNINIKLGGKGFFDYLFFKQAIKKVNNDSLLVINPFFKTYANTCNNELILFSEENTTRGFKGVEKNKFSLIFNPEKYFKKNGKSSHFLVDKYFYSIKKVEFFVTNQNKISAAVKFKTSPQNYLYQLLKGNLVQSKSNK
ncbi:hypothetical protein [Tenacibaculum insulae]|uniref:hypothetical protein n=1 Tax=Tenacibaculum insulae TaxID=2029677 RepID=UPI003AB6DD55